MPEETDLIERLRREEEQLPPRKPLNLPLSAGRMYMGPALEEGVEEAFLEMPSGTMWNEAPPPIGPPPTELERLRAASPPWATPISIRRDVPMTIPEEPAAARFALLSEYQRLRSAGLPESEAVSRLGLDYFTPQGRYSRLTPYQEAAIGLRSREADLRAQQIEASRQAQSERLAREARKEATVAPPGLELKYKSLLSAAQKAADGFDTDLQRSTQDALSAFERDNPEFFRRGGISPSVVRPPAGAGGKIRVRSPSGKFGYIPASQLRAAMAQGYTQAQ